MEAVLADAQKTGYDEVLVLGDLVGYGADPSAVIARTLELSPTAMIRGNHDKVCAGLETAAGFNEVARRSAEWTAETLSAADLKVLADLPRGPRLVAGDVEICHGATFDEDHYVFSPIDAARSLEAATGRICLFGHTHLPAIYTSEDDPTTTDGVSDDELRLPVRGPALINVGSVGQPRDGDSRAAYGILDLDRQTILMRRVPYDIAGAQMRILDAGLPAWLALRLTHGQ
jgi:diadenosine tetraphosphatase ApaH/serine/threonine PP2A family protein phosphatase